MFIFFNSVVRFILGSYFRVIKEEVWKDLVIRMVCEIFFIIVKKLFKKEII